MNNIRRAVSCPNINLTNINLTNINLKSTFENKKSEILKRKMVEKIFNNKNVKISKVSEIDTKTVKPYRAGIIFYILDGQNISFALGTDSKTHELTDFSGSVKYSKGETCIEGALREFEEETLGIFGKIAVEEISDFYAIYDEDNMVIFIMLEASQNTIRKAFNEKIKNIKNPEICSIFFITSNQFRYLIRKTFKEHVIYEKLRKFLYKSNIYKMNILAKIV